jgi:hypothetical protein
VASGKLQVASACLIQSVLNRKHQYADSRLTVFFLISRQGRNRLGQDKRRAFWAFFAQNEDAAEGGIENPATGGNARQNGILNNL